MDNWRCTVCGIVWRRCEWCRVGDSLLAAFPYRFSLAGTLPELVSEAAAELVGETAALAGRFASTDGESFALRVVTSAEANHPHVERRSVPGIRCVSQRLRRRMPWLLSPWLSYPKNCADRQRTTVSPTANRVPIESTAPLLQRAASAAGGDIPAKGLANEWHRQRYLW